MTPNQQGLTTISVGIMAQSKLSFRFNTTYHIDKNSITGQANAQIRDGKIEVIIGKQTFLQNEFLFTTNDGNFSLDNVTIGVDFHWQKKEQQTFQGNIKLIIEDDKVRLINILDIEAYLCSNISSEMSATNSIELLKAHTIVSRSWLLAQLAKRNQPKNYNSCIETDEERIKWYDREDHTLFDVCADDHCQRYQGITRIVSPLVKEAVEATRGMVLMSNNEICDARYSKACGGISERFDYCWEPVNYPYLQAVIDSDSKPELSTDLTIEKNAEQWILNNPEAFCNTQNKQLLRQVLNDYDQDTADFYRWKIKYSQDELSEIINKRSGIDFGQIISLTPLSRGTSGRIYRLKIEGTKRTIIVGKELEIRKWLSKSHLYSSAFVVQYGKITNNIPEIFTLIGAGWGHGVGLCQIGAAVMADKGYNYKEILFHYFKGAEIQNL